jgi:hypothetical protein
MKMLRKILGLSCSALILASALGATPALAAGEGQGAVLTAEAPPPLNSTGCPSIRWDVVRTSETTFKGIVFFTDLRGTSVMDGTVARSGAFHATVRSVVGDGPTGTVTGRRTPSGLQANLVGPGCSHVTVGLQYETPQTVGGRG